MPDKATATGQPMYWWRPTDIEARLEDESVVELRDWASLWGDLLHVEKALEAREGVSNVASGLFVRRALWESAVISYGRTATSGRRGQQIAELLGLLGPAARAFHDEVMFWRNRHVAHRVDDSREQAEARVVIDPEEARIKAVRIRVKPTLGPEDEGDDLATQFKGYVLELRSLVWTRRIEPLEQKAIADHSVNLSALLDAAKSSPEPSDEGFWIDIVPAARNSLLAARRSDLI